MCLCPKKLMLIVNKLVLNIIYEIIQCQLLKKKTTGDMEIDVFSRVVILNYIGMSLWLLFTGFDFLVNNLVLKIQRRLC
jgi:hypothetical protein